MMLYRIKRALRNLKNWLPIILKDEQWEYTYLYTILLKKLELKEEFFRSDDTHIEDWEQVADEIREAKGALERLIKEDYISYEEHMKDVLLASKREEELIQEDLRIVFDGLKNNVRKWWD